MKYEIILIVTIFECLLLVRNFFESSLIVTLFVLHKGSKRGGHNFS